MNEWDRDNLNFILNASTQELKAFYDECDTDDLMYLGKLVAWDLSRLRILEAEEYDKVVEIDLAQSVLKKFMLNK
jgi:hypothetical protein